MSIRRIELSPVHDALIERHLASGDFRDASDVIQMALTAFDHDGVSDAAKLQRLSQLIAEGIAELDRGEGAVIQADEVGTYFRRRAETLARDARR